MRFALPKALIALLALACTCAMGATVAQAYSHTAGPFWSINGAKLGAGESHEALLASGSNEWSILRKLDKVILTDVTCKHQAVEGASIAGGIPSTITATFKLSECAVTGNGKECKVEEPIKAAALTGTLGYETKERTGKILAILEAPHGELMKIKFTGSNCALSTNIPEGSVIAEIVSNEKTEEAGKETEAKVDRLRLPTTPIKAVWVENEAKELKEKTASLRAFSGLSGEGEMTGTSELELSGLPEWGIAANHSVEGPFWIVKGLGGRGEKLNTNESREAQSASSSGEYSITVGNLMGFTITCKKQAVEKASIAGGIPSTIKATFSFSECAVKVNENDSECKVSDEPLKTEPLTGELGYQTNEGTGKILARFEGPTSRWWSYVTEFSSGCAFTSLERSSGALIAEIVSEGKVEEVGKYKYHEAKVNQLRFPATPINALWVENGAGELKEKTASMTGDNKTEEIAGTSELELVSLSEWGVET